MVDHAKVVYYHSVTMIHENAERMTKALDIYHSHARVQNDNYLVDMMMKGAAVVSFLSRLEERWGLGAGGYSEMLHHLHLARVLIQETLNVEAASGGKNEGELVGSGTAILTDEVEEFAKVDRKGAETKVVLQ